MQRDTFNHLAANRSSVRNTRTGQTGRASIWRECGNEHPIVLVDGGRIVDVHDGKGAPKSGAWSLRDLA